MHVISIRFESNELYRDLKRSASLHKRSINAEVLEAVENHVATLPSELRARGVKPE